MKQSLEPLLCLRDYVWYSSNKQFILEEVLFVSELFSYKLILFFRLLRKQEQKQNPDFICLMAYRLIEFHTVLNIVVFLNLYYFLKQYK